MFFWEILAIILFVLDISNFTTLLIGFSISAIITSKFATILSFKAELILFIITGILLTIIIRPKLKKTPTIKNYEDNLEGVILKSSNDMITNKLYQENVNGIFWNIKSTENIAKNQTIKVIKVDKENNYLIVKSE